MAATSLRLIVIAKIGVALLLCLPLFAAILPEDRADVMYHTYEGGGVDITVPAVLVRKSFLDKFSVSTKYYVDKITSASIDVITTASAYTEERKETSLGVDYLYDKSLLSFNYTISKEDDFDAESMHFDISQEFFGDLTTLSMGYSQGTDIVSTGNNTPEFENKRRNFRLGLSQIITKNSLLALNWETITDEGEKLNNPYRQVRVIDSSAQNGFSYIAEIYPETRTSDTIALRGAYYLPYRAAIKLEYKLFSDTWGIRANTAKLVYTHPFREHWIFELTLRNYQQTQADFYRDLFPDPDATQLNFYARDKELSEFSSTTIGIGVSYEKELKDWETFDKYSINLNYDLIRFKYDNFTDLTVYDDPGASFVVGNEPAYSFDAKILRLFFSIYY